MIAAERARDPERGVQVRAVWAAGFIAVAFSLLSGRLIYLQVVRADELAEKALKERIVKQTLPARRGMIMDRFGEILARDQPVSNVYADRFHLQDIGVASRGLAKAEGVSAADIVRNYSPGEIREKYLERIAEEIHRPLGMHRWELMRKLTDMVENKKSDVYLAKGLNDRESENLEELMDEKQIGGVHLRPTLKRYYPVDGRAMHAIGFVNISNEGLEGIEGTLNTTLRGRDGFREVERDRYGRELTSSRGRVVPPIHGAHLTLTIDMRIQDIVEGALDRLVEKYDPEKAVVIVVDPFTGEILGMANRPDFSRESSEGSRRNAAVCDVYEPGSTFKIVTVAGVFDMGLATPTTSIFCHNGYYEDSSLPTPLTDSHPYGDLTVCGILAKSSNIGTYKLARQLGNTNLYRYALAFGFGQKTQIALNAEATGTVHPLAAWDGTTLSRMPMGYAVSVTPLQMVMAYCAVANGGQLMRPRIVRSVEDSTGRTVKEFRPEMLRRVISKDAADSLGNALVQVSQEGGTGTKAQVEGFRVAGKTGTSSKVREDGKGYYKNKNVVSFVGYLPADDPKIAVLVMVDDPKAPTKADRYGGTVAAPCFSEIEGKTMEILGVERPPALVAAPDGREVRRAIVQPRLVPITESE